VEQIRVLLAEMPQMLGEVFRRVVRDQPDMTVVGEISDPLGLLLEVGSRRAQVVIMGSKTTQPPGICSHLFNEYPHVKVLSVRADGRRALLCDLRPRRVVIADASVQALLDIVRAAFAGGGAQTDAAGDFPGGDALS